jgi:Ran GTPase-activating protein (RanGAP) involved in mRNA processing and transport
LKQLGKLPQLVQLDLQDNPVASENAYRQTVFEVCKQLEILDNHDRDGQEINYSDDEDEDDEVTNGFTNFCRI